MTQTFTKVKIQPYIEGAKPNMGLEKYEQVLFDGAEHNLEMVALEEGNTVRYITGCNPYAPDIVMLPDEEREAKVEQIKKVVLKAEAAAGNPIKEDDADWFTKTKRTRPDNIAFWSSPDMRLKVGNDPVYMEPARSVTDLLKYTSIKAGGFPEIAISLEDARTRNVRPKFYLDELEQTASLHTEVKKLKNQAGAKLQSLYEKNVPKLMYVCKVLDANSSQYKKSTPVDVMYDNMDKYINGETVETDKRKTAKNFSEVSDLDMETLKLRALVKDATFYKMIAIKGDGMIYEMGSGTAMGKNPVQVVEFLKNPLNDEILKKLLGKIETFWKQ